MSGKATPERLAELVAAALRPVVRDEIREVMSELERVSGPDEWLTPEQCAARYGGKARWWRAHADEFGVDRRGDGPRPRLFLNAAIIDRRRAG